MSFTVKVKEELLNYRDLIRVNYQLLSKCQEASA